MDVLQPEITGSSPADWLESPRIGVSLSGGGYRAAAFGLGSLLYLADAGLMSNVTTVSSVSGGSITNAFGASYIFAQDGRTGHVDHWARSAWLLQTLAGRDLLPLVPIIRARVVVPVLATSALLGAAAVTSDGLPRLLWALAALLAVAFFLRLIYVAYRDLGLDAMIRLGDWLLEVSGRTSEPPRRRSAWTLLCGLFYVCTFRVGRAAERVRLAPSRPVQLHDIRCAYRPVFCTTDLVSGTHFYISNEFVGGIGPDLKDLSSPSTQRETVNLVGSAPDMPLARAVVASAAFIGFFQPVVEESSALGLPHRRGVVPGVVRLADGGLYDNLGFTLHKLWHDGDLDPALLDDLGARPNLYIVVNSGTPAFSWKRIGPVEAIRRSVNIVHQANGRARREQVLAFGKIPGNHCELVEISDDPYTIARTAEKPEWAEQIRLVLGALTSNGQVLSRSWWSAMSGEWSRSVETRLDALGSRDTARLVLHGYMATLAHMTARYGMPVPPRTPALDDLERICAGGAPTP